MEENEEQQQRGGTATKLTPEVRQLFCDAIAAGNTYDAAAAYAGIAARTWRKWKAEVEEAQAAEAAGATLRKRERDLLAFGDEVHQAKMEAMVRWQGVVNEAAQNDPAWAWRMLRLRDPENYREVTETQVSGTLSVEEKVIFYLPHNGRDDDAST